MDELSEEDLGFGGDGEGDLGLGEDRQEGSASSGERESSIQRVATPALRERGLIEEIGEEAREVGLRGWFNGDYSQDALGSWSGPNSNVSETHDHTWVTNLTTIGGHYLLLPVSGLKDLNVTH